MSVAGAARAVTAETVQPVGEVGIVAAEAALHDHGSDLGSLLRVAAFGRGAHHARKPAARAATEPLAGGGDAGVHVERFELRQLRARRVDGGGRRRSRSTTGSEDLLFPIRSRLSPRSAERISRTRRRRPALGLPLVPQAIADAGLSTAGAAPALIGGRTRHAHRLQAGHRHVRLEPWNPRKAAVDDDTYALDGDRRLGIEVASTTLRRLLGAGASARSCAFVSIVL